MDIKEGQEFFVNGNAYIIKDGLPVPAVKRGPLGGEIVSCAGGVAQSESDSFVKVTISAINSQDNYCRFYLGTSKHKLEMPLDEFSSMGVETNIPPRLTGEKMTAGEAAMVPDIVGRWVAVRVDQIDDQQLQIPLSAGGSWYEKKDELILLLEGFGE